ncbi:hypothetical protein ACU4GD_14035 [Cupriavidus basilensis]
MTVGYVADDLTPAGAPGAHPRAASDPGGGPGHHQRPPLDPALRRRALAAPTTAAQQPPRCSAPPPLPRSQRVDFLVGDTVSFTDQHLRERIGTIVRVNQKTASVECDPNEGHWRVSFALLRKVVDL